MPAPKRRILCDGPRFYVILGRSINADGNAISQLMLGILARASMDF